MKSAVLTVCRKEILDNARDRRTLLTATLFGPIMGPVFFVFIMNFTVSQAITSRETPIQVPIIGAEHADNLVTFLGSRGITASEGHNLESRDDAIDAVRGDGQELVVYIDESFGEELTSQVGAHVGLIYDESDTRSDRRAGRVRGAINAYSQQISSLRLLTRGIDPIVVRPLIVDSFDVSTPSGRSSLLLGVLTYFLLFSTLLGGQYLAIDTTAGERERKSLEPLLTTPVGRSSLLLGKMGATVAYMLISLALTLFCLTIALRYMPFEELGMSSSFGPVTALVGFLLLAPFAPLGAALMTVVASFTKSFKEAQGYVAVVMIVPTMPLIFASIVNVRPSLELMAVPSLSQHLLFTSLLRQEPIEPLMLAISVASTLLLGAALLLVAMRLYDREGILG